MKTLLDHRSSGTSMDRDVEWGGGKKTIYDYDETTFGKETGDGRRRT